MRSRPQVPVVPFILSALCFATAALADTHRIIVLDVPGSAATAVRGINDSGQAVGSFTRSNVTRGFLYSGGSFFPLDFPGASATIPSAIDNSGHIAGSYMDDGLTWHGFLYSGGSFSTIDVPSADATRILGMNDPGDLAGWFTDDLGEHGFLFSGGMFTTLDVPGAVATFATGINNAAEIVGTWTTENSSAQGFVYTEGAFSKLDAPAGEQPLTLGINDASQIAGFPGWLYSDAVFTAIDIAPGRASHAAIDNAGRIAGSYFDADGVEHGFITAFPVELPVRIGAATVSASHPVPSKLSPAVSSSPGLCDITGNGVVNVADIQVIVNEALGASPPVHDLNSDGIVNVADVQIVINAALQLGCAATLPQQGTPAVAHVAVQSGNGQVACLCITATLQAFQPISVKATDVGGHPVAGATVTWTVTSGQIMLAGPSSVTDSNGIATQGISSLILNNFSSSAVPYLISTIQASSNNNSVGFTETQSLVSAQGASVIGANPPQFAGGQLGATTLSASVGATLTTPIQTNIAGVGIASNGVQNVSVRILNQQSSPSLTCVTGGNNADPGSVLSDAQGNTSCYPIFSGSGNGMYYVLVGGVPGIGIANARALQALGPFNFSSLAGPPAAIQIVSGDAQVAPIGQALNPLVARVVDAQGNVEPGQTVAWSVFPAGAASLNNTSFVADSTGLVSITGSLGLLASAGATITVSLAGNPAVSATFHETIPGALTAMTIVSGNNQSAVKGATFAAPLVIQLVNASGPVANFPVHYTATGPVTLTSTVAGTDSAGHATLTVIAGASTGTATVTATAGALTQTFTLTITAP